jgi:hypothetical protein
MKMTFLPEGPLVSLTGRGIAIPEPNDAATRHSPRNKLKQACSTVLHWGNDRFEEVEVIGKNCLCVGFSAYDFLQSNSYSA